VLPRGVAIVDLLVPDWAGAQAEAVALPQQRRSRAHRCGAYALTLLGMSAELIERRCRQRTIRDDGHDPHADRGRSSRSMYARHDGEDVGATLAKIDASRLYGWKPPCRRPRAHWQRSAGS
jgi:hypothetical protein